MAFNTFSSAAQFAGLGKSKQLSGGTPRDPLNDLKNIQGQISSMAQKNLLPSILPQDAPYKQYVDALGKKNNEQSLASRFAGQQSAFDASQLPSQGTLLPQASSTPAVAAQASGVPYASSVPAQPAVGISQQVSNAQKSFADIVKGANLTEAQVQAIAAKDPAIGAKIQGILGGGQPSATESFLRTGQVPSSTFNSQATRSDVQAILDRQAEDRQKLMDYLAPGQNEVDLQNRYFQNQNTLNTYMDAIDKSVAGINSEPISASAMEGRVSALGRDAKPLVASLQRQGELLTQQLGVAQDNRKMRAEAMKSLLGFDDSDLKRIDDGDKAFQAQMDKLSDNARSTITTMLSQFGGMAFTDLSPAAQQQVQYLAAQAGMPIDVLASGMQTMKEKQFAQKQMEFAALQQQRETSNALRALSISNAAQSRMVDPSLLAQIQANPRLMENLPVTAQQAYMTALAQGGNAVLPKLTSKQKDAADQAINGISAVRDAISMYESNPEIVNKAIAGYEGVGGFISRVSGASDWVNAVKNATDVITRMRTGAALNESEIAFYKSMTPMPGDSYESGMKKLNTLYGFYLGMSGMPVTLQGSDGSAIQYGNMYDPKQRLEMMEALKSGQYQVTQ